MQRPGANHRIRRLFAFATGVSLLILSSFVMMVASSDLLAEGFAFFAFLIGIYLAIMGVLGWREKRNQLFASASMKVALVAVFSAVSLGTNYAMIDIPNVKLMDAMVFIAAFLFGLDVGVASAACIWLVYGFVNPYGIASPVLLSFLIAGECFYAITGGLLRRTSTATRMFRSDSYRHATIVFGGLGLLTTFAYDALTNFATYLFLANSLYQAFLIGIITGAPFALLHELSNLVFFGTIVPSVIYAARRFRLGVGED